MDAILSLTLQKVKRRIPRNRWSSPRTPWYNRSLFQKPSINKMFYLGGDNWRGLERHPGDNCETGQTKRHPLWARRHKDNKHRGVRSVSIRWGDRRHHHEGREEVLLGSEVKDNERRHEELLLGISWLQRNNLSGEGVGWHQHQTRWLDCWHVGNVRILLYEGEVEEWNQNLGVKTKPYVRTYGGSVKNIKDMDVFGTYF